MNRIPYVLSYLFRLYIYWMAVFFLFRLLFIIYTPPANDSFMELLTTFISGWRLDVSFISYVAVIPFFLLSVLEFKNLRSINIVIQFYLYVITVIGLLLLFANVLVYDAWGTLINRRALAFINDPVEMLASLTNRQLIVFGCAVMITTSLFLLALKRIVIEVKANKENHWAIKIVSLLVSAFFIFAGIRGGFQLIPVNESAAYFSSNNQLNHIAVNPLWHLGNNLIKTAETQKNIYAELSENDCNKLLENLYVKHDSATINILAIQKPNIVFLLLESFTSDIVEPLGGEKGVTPFLNSLCDSGLLFTNIYSSGRRTDQALPSIISGFPAQPEYSIMRYTDKTEGLPSFTKDLKKTNYTLSFFYGGELAFCNMNSFLLHSGFENIIGKNDFEPELQNSKWGVHDEFVLTKQLVELNNEKEPFVSMLLTQSSHEPFDVPFNSPFNGNDSPSKFRNAAYYADLCLRNYFMKAKKEKWYDNTLFVLVADHGHILPREREYHDVATHKIPLLFFGPALKREFVGKQNASIGNQNDIAATLLHQLDLDSRQYLFSNDLLDSLRQNFAYNNFDDYFGWVTEKGSYIYNSSTKEVSHISLESPDSLTLKKAVAYRQKLYQLFLDLGN